MQSDDKRALLKLLESLLHSHRRHEVFEDFITLADTYLRMLPVHAESIATTGAPAKDDEETAAMFISVGKRYGDDYSVLARAVTVLSCSAQGDEEIADLVGEIYEEFGVSNAAHSQFFTPWDVTTMMARMALEGYGMPLLVERISAAVGPDVAGLFDLSAERPETLRYVAETLLPHSIDQFQPVTIADPACGSGRFLLAAARQFPRWVVRNGLVQLFGQDIDGLCVKMASVNMCLQGLNSWGLKYNRAGLILLQSQAPTNPIEPLPVTPDFTLPPLELFGDIADAA